MIVEFWYLKLQLMVLTYLLINLHNANTESEQLTKLKNLNKLLKDFEDFHDEKMIFAGHFNLIFDKNLESVEGSPLIKKHSLSEIIKINKTFSLWDIWRVCNPHKKTINFPTKTFHWYYTMKTWLKILESVKNTEILNGLSPIPCFLLIY